MTRKRMLFCLCFAGIMIYKNSVLAENLSRNSLDVHGFISQGFLKGDGNNVFANTKDGSFQFNEFGLNFSSDLTERLHAGLQLFSRDLGDIDNNELKLDWAYSDFRWRDWLGIRAGKIKIPYGFYNETRDIDMLRTSIFLPPSLYYEGNRDMQSALFGAGIYGYTYLSQLGGFSYQFQIGETGISESSSAIKYAQDQEMTNLVSIEVTRQYTLNLEWETPLEGLRLGGFLMQSDLSSEFEDSSELSENSNDTAETSDETESSLETSDDIEEDEQRRYYIFSAEYNWENLLLAGEYLHPENSREPLGYYVSAAYRFTDYFELGGYYSVFYRNANDKDGQKAQEEGRPDYYAWQKELVLTSRFDINEHWTVKVEGHAINGAAQMLEQYNPGGIQEDSYLLAIKTTYHF